MIFHAGASPSAHSVNDAVQLGMALVPESRRSQACSWVLDPREHLGPIWIVAMGGLACASIRSASASPTPRGKHGVSVYDLADPVSTLSGVTSKRCCSPVPPWVSRG